MSATSPHVQVLFNTRLPDCHHVLYLICVNASFEGKARGHILPDSLHRQTEINLSSKTQQGGNLGDRRNTDGWMMDVVEPSVWSLQQICAI